MDLSELLSLQPYFFFCKRGVYVLKTWKKNASPDIDDYQATKAEESEDQ